MKKVQKILLTIALAVILVFAYTVKVSATEGTSYTFNDLTNGNTIELGLNDTFDTLDMNSKLVGDVITLDEGKITIGVTGSAGELTLTITLEGKAVVNESQVANLANNSIKSLEITITEGSTLTINGTLVIPSANGSNSITNNGTITINEGGTLEVRKGATYTDNNTSKINVYGTLAIFGEKFTASSNSINLYETGKIYSYTELDEEINVAEINEEYNYSLKIDTGTYDSTASTATIDIAKVYSLSAEAVEESSSNSGNDENDPSDDSVVDDPTTDESVADDSEVVDSTEDEVVDETVVDETVVDEESENPATGDEIAIFAAIFVVALVGLVTTLIVKKKMK